MGCHATKKAEQQIQEKEKIIQRLAQQNQDLSTQLNTIREQEMLLLSQCELRPERQKIDLTALADELDDRFQKMLQTIKQLEILTEEQKQMKVKELIEWRNLFDKLEGGSQNLSCIQEEDEK
ncbi:hypothetical protein pb186bvf_008703 [Paramecium bursaria]